jgi:hypothetical protein
LKLHLPLAGAIALCLGAGGVALAGDNPNEHKGDADDQACINSLTDQEEGTFSLSGVLSAWPPNHKPRDITFTLTDTDGDPLDGVTIEVVGTHDEIGQNGSGSTPDQLDAAGGTGEGDGSASTGATYLAERSGNGDGRVYTWTVTGTTDDGLATCDPVTYETTVVHDQGTRGGDE